jgi:site-specific DNA-methyltransferase (adenine-specific)
MELKENTFYDGDCLFVLKHDIPSDSVDLIYLDPPFFTGKVQKGTVKAEWQPEAMEVSFEDRKEYWAKHLDNMREKAPAWLSSIAIRRPEFAAYLYYMMERLQACHRALKKTGSIYLHCDYRASHYLKMVMDEIFGEDSFRNEIIWRIGWISGYKTQKIGWIRNHDTILYYTKSDDFTFNKEKNIYHIHQITKGVEVKNQ